MLRWPDAEHLVAAIRAAAEGSLAWMWPRLPEPMLWRCRQLGLTPDVATITGDGRLPLVEAARLAQPPTIDLLLRLGADLHARDGTGHTAFDFAGDRQTADCLATWSDP